MSLTDRRWGAFRIVFWGSFMLAALGFIIVLVSILWPTWGGYVVYTCTACLKGDASQCRTGERDWEVGSAAATAEMRFARHLAVSELCELCDEKGYQVRYCRNRRDGDPEADFDIRCTSRNERRRTDRMNFPVH